MWLLFVRVRWSNVSCNGVEFEQHPAEAALPLHAAAWARSTATQATVRLPLKNVEDWGQRCHATFDRPRERDGLAQPISWPI